MYRCMPVGQKTQNIGGGGGGLQKSARFSCPELFILVTNGFQSNIERLKMCFSNTIQVSDLLK